MNLLQRVSRSATFSWTQPIDANISLDAAGLVALADLTTTAERTALTGTSALLDCFVLCPGLHRQQAAPELNGGEYPACAAMTTGYVFRVENQATVSFLQKVGVTGQLTTLSVDRIPTDSRLWRKISTLFYAAPNATFLESIAYFTAVCMTFAALILLALSPGLWGLSVFLILIFARFCNVVVIRRRTQIGWKGASEPGVKGDLLVLLSQDRWVRIQGAVDDLKAVTSGQWLRDMTFAEASGTAIATVLVYLDAALASNVSQSGKIVLLILLIASAGLLAIANERREVLQMQGNIIKIDRPRQTYERRLDMVKELIKETGRDDWATRMGMIVPERREESAAKEKEVQAQAELVM
jgi:hypothetical protein